MDSPRTRMYTHPFFEATPPGAAPGPPVNTGARVRHFRGCKNRSAEVNAPCRSTRSGATAQRRPLFRLRADGDFDGAGRG